MNRDVAVNVLDRLHQAQNEMYAGGSTAALRSLLNPDVTWTVPGENPIAGSTVGLYDISDEQITACWLLPLDPKAFDAIWAL